MKSSTQRIFTYLVALFCLLHLFPVYANDTLYANGRLTKAGEYIQSRPDGNYVARISPDGSFAIYRQDGSTRFKTANGGDFAVMQADGNFVLYKDLGGGHLNPIWNTVTGFGISNSVTVSDDGDLIIYTPGPTKRKVWNLGSDPIWGDPKKVGDVLGRDLAYAGVGFAGHVGVWDGQQIFEANGGVAQNNKIAIVQLFDFKHVKNQTGYDVPYWGTVSYYIPSANITMTACWAAVCPTPGSTVTADARYSIALRAMQIYRIGADYTFTTNYVRALSTWGSSPAVRGIYRCDTFVLDTLYQSTFFTGNLSSAQKLWVSRWNSLTTGIMTPGWLFTVLKGFQ